MAGNQDGVAGAMNQAMNAGVAAGVGAAMEADDL